MRPGMIKKSQAVEDGEEEEDHVELVGQPEEVVGLLADLGDGEDEDDGHGDVEEDAGEAGENSGETRRTSCNCLYLLDPLSPRLQDLVLLEHLSGNVEGECFLTILFSFSIISSLSVRHL